MRSTSLSDRKPRTAVPPPAVGIASRDLPRSPPARKRILLVDDHPLMREGIAQWILREPGFEICGQAETASEAIRLTVKHRPDLVLTDLSLQSGNGLELIKDLQALQPGILILVVSMHDELVYAERALRAGARGYIMKEAGGDKLLAAVRQVFAGQVYVSPNMSAAILDDMAGTCRRDSNSPFKKLSDREFEVFQLIGQGHSTREMAARLHLSPKTVAVHRSHIKAKLKLADKAGLNSFAIRWMAAQ